MIFIIKVTTNKEEKSVELIGERIERKSLSVFAIAKPHGLKGYIILEALDRESAEEAVFNLPYVKGIIGKTVEYKDIQNMLQPKVEEMNIEIGDIVEIIAKTFKGEQAKVTRIDKQKGEVVVSLLGASVPIPVTVKMDSVKVIRREKGEKEESKEKKEEKTIEEEFELE
ncbi:transcription elongation factor Spt5 [Candidatus Pacearchaeota archaeon]|nr:transcription elongation factor Spt5 [Candidatus Pacearchaeota archaeon]